MPEASRETYGIPPKALEELEELLDPTEWKTDEGDRRKHGHDSWVLSIKDRDVGVSGGALPAGVARPTSTEQVSRLLAWATRHGVPVVPYGAGSGVMGELLERDGSGATYGFVEPIPALERRLEARFGSDANYRHREDLSQVDAVMLLDVLEHQDDDRQLLGEVVSRLSPGARVAITVPAGQWLWSSWDVALGHVRRYRKQTLEASWQGLPVQCVVLRYLFPEMIPPAALRRLRELRPRHDAGSDAAEFPDLSPRVNELLYTIGRTVASVAPWSPVGTSVLAVLEVGPAAH